MSNRKHGSPSADEMERDTHEMHDAPGPKARRRANGAARRLPLTMLHELGPVGVQDRLVRGMLGEGVLAVIYGEPGSGKSFAASDLSIHVALGWPWLDRKVTPGGVLYVASEGGGGWANRVEAFCRHHKLTQDQRKRLPMGFILASVDLGPHGGDVEGIVQAAAELADKSKEPVRLIVIDTLARAMVGGDENSSIDMSAFVAKCEAIRQHTSATVLIVHHSGKNAALGARGHSALRAAIDAEFEVERSERGRLLRVRKAREGSSGDEIGFALEVVEVGIDHDDADNLAGTAITSCVVLPSDVAPAARGRTTKGNKPPPSLRAFMDAVKMALHDHGHTITLFADGSAVRAVDLEKVRERYFTMRADIKEASRRTVFPRHLETAIDRQAVVAREIGGATLVWLPQR